MNKNQAIKTIDALCKAVSKHTVENPNAEDEDEEMVSVAFSGNCGVFMVALVNFINKKCPSIFPDTGVEFGFLFTNIDSLKELEDENVEADLNHVMLNVYDKWFDGDGITDPKKWHGKLLLANGIEEACEIIDLCTEYCAGSPEIEKLFEKEWKKLSKKDMNENTKVTLTIGQLKKLIKESGAFGDFLRIPRWNVEELTGYTPKTTFWQDFSIADKFGDPAIKDTFNRAFKEWKDNVEYCTELVMVLNHKSWQWSEEDSTRSELYIDLYEKAYDYGLKHFKDKDLDYFIDTLD